MTEQKTETVPLQAIFKLSADRKFGWEKNDGTSDHYFLVQNPEAWHPDCYAAVTGPAGGPGNRVTVHIIPSDTEITFKV